MRHSAVGLTRAEVGKGSSNFQLLTLIALFLCIWWLVADNAHSASPVGRECLGLKALTKYDVYDTN